MKAFNSAIAYIALFLVATFAAKAQSRTTSKELIRKFIEQVRSGKHPENAGVYRADTVLAHQFEAENPITIKRTPKNYEDHIRDFLKMYGPNTFEVSEILSEGDKVYVRWIQTGRHIGMIDGFPPTGKSIIEYASCVYRIANGKIVEYWIQIDRLGFQRQLKKDAQVR